MNELQGQESGTNLVFPTPIFNSEEGVIDILQDCGVGLLDLSFFFFYSSTQVRQDIGIRKEVERSLQPGTDAD
ncbi:MAG: hypothetical protein K6T90_17430 [Leptolyngbyaceae cyanobacterium HOT.MB2.61]|nr:hypothetical protein [Leptolyngbyaceae cyanobacterium HOT.MB2.61]